MAGPPIAFRIDKSVEGGVYANVAGVWHTRHEFTIDFAATLPAEVDQTPDGAKVQVVPARITTRVKLPVSVVFDLLKAINANMSQYEAKFGPLTSAAGDLRIPPDMQIQDQEEEGGPDAGDDG